ncbi:MAG: FMN-binding glutamate synthase family protein [Archaeoglobi archaeon]|nr:4Fe-4S dicluster domain-containing protein [Archaeoglobales archaeon]TDA26964.1 MAG: FMN-binding glutamate synthase family protein [Archaeoglobi archaeon]TDA27781.1 MAG: FMN-binding glutamate synthase family protein [Archaeoglobi archaeon]
MKSYLEPEFIIERDDEKCTRCKICIEQCTYGVHYYNSKNNIVRSRDENCVNCHRCVVFCPTKAITIRRNPTQYTENWHWTKEVITDIKKQAETGRAILTGMGCDKPYYTYWDKILLNASQVTNPSIDPLREPIEIRTYLGAKPDKLELEMKNNDIELKTKLTPQLCAETPILFAAISLGAVNFNVHLALARAAAECGTFMNCGEGGLDKRLYQYGDHIIVQVASGRFGVSPEYLNAGAAIEIKIGQGAKPGIGGHLPGEKVTQEIAQTRMIPVGTDALSPAPHHDIYSIEDLRQLIYALKEATDYTKPVAVKIAAVHNCAAIASGMVRAGADIIVLDGIRGATGAAPKVIRDNVGIPIELALASVDQRLRDEGIRNKASIIVSGGIRNSADIVKAIALGADAVYIGTAALVAIGCTLCQKCYTGKCPWGIATTDPRIAERLDPDVATKRLVNLLQAWSIEIKEMLGAMGINAIESLRGNREQLRGVGLTETELKILGIKMAGE